MSTTTTTYADLTDAQMLDYAADTDFSMHAMGSSPDWLTVEATMSDDSNSMSDAALQNYSETIEVDMEPHAEDEEMTEYEMADGAVAQHDSNQDTELVDIEVIDPSHAPTPTPTSSLPIPDILSETFVQQSPTAILNIAEPPSATAETPILDSDRGEYESTEHAAAASDSSPDFQHVQAQSPLLYPTVGEGVPSEIPTAPDTSSDTGATHVAPAPADASTTGTLKEEAAEVPVDEGTVAFVAIASEDAIAKDLAEAVLEPHDEPPAHEVDVQGESVTYADDENRETTVETGHDADLSTGEDPHEISDGVYIDPPPAVLLSIVSSAGLQDCTLFNQPHTPSLSQNPNGYASSSTSAEPLLLLQQHPTLYYEPLSNVFDALRQEEAVYNNPEFADGELVLDAYDLDLRIVEDNVYAREVTIHELNIVHDGIDLRGPLRLRLTSSTPRFITRYHTLRDQVAQLTLGLNDEITEDEDEVDANEEAAKETGEHEPDQDESALELSPKYEEVADQEYRDGSLYQQEQETTSTEAPNALQSHDIDSLEDIMSRTVQNSHLSPEDTNDPGDLEAIAGDVDADADRVDDTHDEYGTELNAEEAAEGLDADEVHQFADAEDGGDYTDYAQNVDGDDHFGEDSANHDSHEVDEDSAIPNLVEPADGSETPENGTEASTAAYDEPNDLSTLSSVETHDGGEDVDSATVEGGESPQAETDYETTADFGEAEQLQDYDEPTRTDALDHIEALHDTEWEDHEDTEDLIESPKDNHENDDTLSKYSSETLSSTRSKRSREDDEDEDLAYQSPTETPESKRARVY